MVSHTFQELGERTADTCRVEAKDKTEKGSP